MDERYLTALLDWLACAARGASEPAARAARLAGDGLLERVAAAGAAGHVLDFDDTYEPGLAHLSAPTAPAALVVAAHLGLPLADAVAAYTEGFEAMGALAAASHPALYEAGLHPTAVCGAPGAAVAASALLGLDDGQRESAVALAQTSAGGRLEAFGSDGKAIQVGLAAASGVHAALMASRGARMPLPEPVPPHVDAVAANWIKAWPCCLQTHGAIEAALAMGSAADGEIEVAVHPISRRAAPYDEPADGLQAKFSIPYLTAFALLRGEPMAHSFGCLDAEAAALPVRVVTDPALGTSAAVISAAGAVVGRTEAARGSPAAPLSAAQLAAKVAALAGNRLDGVLDDLGAPAAGVLSAAGI